MRAKQLTKMEQVGLLLVVAVIASFLYLRFVNKDPGRQLKRLKKDYAKISVQVDDLEKQAKDGMLKKQIARLRKKARKAEQQLKKDESRLTQPGDVEQVAGKVVRTATRNGLRVTEFKELTDKNELEKITGPEKPPYPRRYYTMTLKSSFQALKRFIENIEGFPELVAVQRIAIEKVEDEAFVTSVVCLSI